MKAIVFQRYGPPEVLETAELPVPKPAEGQVIVQCRAAALNPKDLFVRKGKFRRFTGKHFPLGVGYDLAGEVIEVGESVSAFSPGQAVFGMLNGWKGSTCAQYVCVPAEEIATMPANISFIQAAAVPMAALTALQALRDNGKLRPGQEVCINGASGGVGVYAVQIAKIMGARVTAVCSERNIELVQQLGADATVDYRRRDVLETAQHCDIFFDVFGNKSFTAAKPLLKRRGRYITTVPKWRNLFDVYIRSLFQFRKAKLVVVKSRRNDLEILAEWIKNRQLKPIIDRVYPMSKVTEGQRYLETKRARGKVVILIEKDD